MGQKDNYQSDFYDNEWRFADAFNGVLFHGKQVMKAEELEEADGELVSFLGNGEHESEGFKVVRDKVKKWRGKYFAIAVMENQSHVDYGMVLRVMKSEALGYEKQRKKAYRKAKYAGEGFDRAEFLSGMKKEQKFIPIITLILYFGTDSAWDGARSLYELLEIDEDLKPYVNDHKLNLYDYHEHGDFSVFKTENRALFEILSRVDEEEQMEEEMEMHPDWYDELDRESAAAIRGIAGIDVDLEAIKKTKEDGREVYDMCKAFKDHMERGRREGREEGRAEGREEGRIEDIKKLMKNLNLSSEQVMKILEIPNEDREKYSSAII